MLRLHTAHAPMLPDTQFSPFLDPRITIHSTLPPQDVMHMPGAVVASAEDIGSLGWGYLERDTHRELLGVVIGGEEPGREVYSLVGSAILGNPLHYVTHSNEFGQPTSIVAVLEGETKVMRPDADDAEPIFTVRLDGLDEIVIHNVGQGELSVGYSVPEQRSLGTQTVHALQRGVTALRQGRRHNLADDRFWMVPTPDVFAYVQTT